MKKVLQKIFSVRNESHKSKVITILGIKFKSKFLKSDLDNLKILCKFLRIKKNKIKEEYKYIHCITHRKEFPNGGAGGGAAVLSCMKNILGGRIKNIKFTFWAPNEYAEDYDNELFDLWGAVQFIFDNVKNEKNTVYITHDYGSAFALFLLGKKYAYVAHLQGPRVEEKLNYGEKFSYISRKIINFCENLAFKNAYCVCFPSKGAYEYYCQSEFRSISPEKFRLGPILYNTLYAYPEPEVIKNIERNDSTLTFLSIGQLTYAKGMDRHTKFFEEVLKKTSKNIRYIFVGVGPFKDKIIEDLNNLKLKFNNFNYVYIERCSYPQIQYLQNITDIYLMLHRISIFDLATLELMNKSKCVILSNTGGNPEFNKNNNIILVKDDDFEKAANEFLSSDIKQIGLLNKQVYDNYFSNEVFIQRYTDLINNLLEKN